MKSNGNENNWVPSRSNLPAVTDRENQNCNSHIERGASKQGRAGISRTRQFLKTLETGVRPLSKCKSPPNYLNDDANLFTKNTNAQD